MKSKSITIEVAEICSIVHHCTGCAGKRNRCCSCYEVTLGSKERQDIEGCIPLAARYCKALKSHDGYENVFEQLSHNQFCIDTNEDGVCAFAYFEATKILCSLHTAAIKSGIPFGKAKPQSCLLWPLAVSDGPDKTLSLQDDALEFGCNKRSKGKFSLCPSIAKNIEWAFGIDARVAVQEAARKKMQRICVFLD